MAATQERREIALFWDYENAPLPVNVSPADAARAIQMAVSRFGQRIEMRRVYFDPYKSGRPADPSGLDSSGFDLVHTPARNMNSTLDKKLIVDVLSFAWDSSAKGREPCVVLITSDGDYAYTLSKLRDRGVMNVVMYGPNCVTTDVLVSNANAALSFERDVLCMRPTSTGNQMSSPISSPLGSPPNAAAPPSLGLGGPSGSRLLGYIGDQGSPASTTATGDNVNNLHTGNINAFGSFDTTANTPTASPAGATSRPMQQLQTGAITTINSGRPSKNLTRNKYTTTNMNSAKFGPIDADLLAFCSCLSDKQRSWEKGVGVSYERAYIPGKVLQDSFRAPSDPNSIPAAKDARDGAIRGGFVETARRSLENETEYHLVVLGQPTEPGRRLTREFFIRLTQKGRSLLEELQLERVQDYCHFLYKKQKKWEQGNRVDWKMCWIPSKIVQKEYKPLYSPAERGEYTQLCKDTRNNSISVGFAETARMDLDSKEFVLCPLGEKVALDGLSRDFYIRLTAVGRQLIESLDE
mmetsp:Transcript_17893/g.51275  ORF Transcript_17893/g.51275 Transcript_17893/m.51275 type:complete len:523 (-) Transcript_17893:2194-3762(-)